MDKHPHILNAASNLLGISLIVITGLNLAGAAPASHADEIAWVAAIALSGSCMLAYLALRGGAAAARFERFADRAFLIGLVTLFASVLWIALDGVPLR